MKLSLLLLLLLLLPPPPPDPPPLLDSARFARALITFRFFARLVASGWVMYRRSREVMYTCTISSAIKGETT